jgi:phenylalanyl-tRNA synthetase alpha chain
MTTNRGTLHPITQYLRRSMAFFGELGFDVLDSPEIATERDNFDALRIPADHPARTMQDTFWLTDGRLPRTHTSAFQIPAMKTRKPPVRLIIPGRVFRNEATDATHETHFNQLEGFVIDENVSFAHLKGLIAQFVAHMYGADVETKFVSAYFPFVEPGLEMYAKVKGYWVEMGGAGMIHPEVLENMGVNSNKFQGFAFGLGIDRLVMLAHGIDDIRYLHGGSLRFLHQFQEEA